MKPICTDWIPQNEYTRPLDGQPYYRSQGIIYALDHQDNRYAVSYIDYERYDDQHFQYVFTPIWHVIDALPPSIFQGIPGLDMDMRLVRYYRVNMTPTFITERTPSEAREDLWELLDSVGLDYYDRFEWLLRTTMRCGTDNLIVERVRNNAPQRIIQYYFALKDLLHPDLHPTDCVSVDNLQQLGTTSRELRHHLLPILRSGSQIRLESEDRSLSDEERLAMLKLLLIQEDLDRKDQREAQTVGIQTAKKSGRYTGRQRLSIDPNVLEAVAHDFEAGLITESEARNRLGNPSRSTFYRRLKELKK